MNPVSGEMEVILRLGGATVAGAVIGLNRELTHKPAGLRTHALVGLGAAVMTLVSVQVLARSAVPDDGAVLRTVQGILTGIGFIGGGVVLRLPREQTVHGLTTAASIWVVAALGTACGLGEWTTVVLGTVLALVTLVVGRPIERRLHAMMSHEHTGSGEINEEDEEDSA
jgi:putative Mg2+ transporter-C (MgtC) family protein